MSQGEFVRNAMLSAAVVAIPCGLVAHDLGYGAPAIFLAMALGAVVGLVAIAAVTAGGRR